jgi:hypothetical protein
MTTETPDAGAPRYTRAEILAMPDDEFRRVVREKAWRPPPPASPPPLDAEAARTAREKIRSMSDSEFREAVRTHAWRV